MRFMRGYRKITVAAIVGATLTMPALAQQFQASITGIVQDSSKAIISGATVEVHNLDTGRIITVKTNGAGRYTVPYLTPGQRYDVSATEQGFNKAIYPPTTLSTSQILTANFTLQLGSVSQVVKVDSQSYKLGLDTGNGDRGYLIDNKTITQMPLNGRNPLSLLDYIPGVTNENGPGSEGTPNNMYNVSLYTFNGTPTQNTDYLIDGMPDNSNPWYSNGPSTIPSVDAIEEFKVITNPYDASFGHSSSGVVSMVLKSGTNELHGSIYEFGKRGFMDANSWYNNYYQQNRPAHTEDQYGFELDGPVYIPKVYDGRNKTFFMFNFEHFKEVLPQAYTFDLPNPAWLQGNFSDFTDASGKRIPIYNPSTATTADPTRQLFAGNRVNPALFNPAAVAILNLIIKSAPASNQSYPNELPWERIWNDTIPQTNSSTNYVAKFDQVIGSRDHLSGNWIRSYNPSEQWSSPVSAPELFNGSTFTEYHMNAGLNWEHTYTPNLISDVRVSYQRYWRRDGPPPSAMSYNPAQLGLSPALLDALPLKTGFPEVTFNMQQQSAGTGDGYSDWFRTSRDFYYMPDDSYNLSPSAMWLHGHHTLHFGIDIRDSHLFQETQWDNIISYTTNGQATSEYWNQDGSNDLATAPDGTPLSQISSGNAILDFLLAKPSNVAAMNQLFPYLTSHYYAPWIEDDWTVTPTFTLNLGFRWDFNNPPTARHNWLNTGFDFNAISPVSNEVAGLGPIKGGITFPSTSGQNTPWKRDDSKWQPRVGFAWLLHPGTLLRGGLGRIVMSPTASPQEYGFANNPVFQNSDDGGRTYFADSIDNPFPGGVPNIPKDSQGLMTYVGQQITINNNNFKLPYTINGSLGIQQVLPHDSRMTLAYVMSRSYDDPVTYTGINENDALYRSCNALLDTPTSLYHQGNCENLTSNPFNGAPGVSGSLGSSPLVSNYQLARPYPQFQEITENLENWGRTWYNSLQATYQQRISWFQFNSTYTWSKSMQSGGYLDDVYHVPFRSISGTDVKNRVTTTFILDIPIGRGQRYFGNMNRTLDAVVGGWELAADGFAQGGHPIQVPDYYNVVGRVRLHKMVRSFNTINLGMNPCTQIWHNSTPQTPGYYSLSEYGQSVDSCSNGASPAWQQEASYAPGYNNTSLNLYTDQVRTPGTNQLDVNLSKNFQIYGRMHLQLRMEEFNVLNHPTWYTEVDNTPTDTNFGMVVKANGQSNNPRMGQLGAKLTW